MYILSDKIEIKILKTEQIIYNELHAISMAIQLDFGQIYVKACCLLLKFNCYLYFSFPTQWIDYSHFNEEMGQILTNYLWGDVCCNHLFTFS